MTRNEVIDLLKLISTFDRRFANREPTKVDVDVWQAVVGDLDFTDACAAVVSHFRESDVWLLPVHIRRKVASIRGERISRAPSEPATEDPDVLDDPEAYLAAVRGQVREAASPEPEQRAIGGGQ